MRKYCIGLKTTEGVQFVLETMANDFEQATAEWARVTGHSDGLLDLKKSTYFGWDIVETVLPPLERKTNCNPFQM